VDIRCIDNMAGKTTWLVNPGTVGGIKAPATWVLGDLDKMTFTVKQVQDTSEKIQDRGQIQGQR
jgi:predicted phosphodiesterase